MSRVNCFRDVIHEDDGRPCVGSPFILELRTVYFSYMHRVEVHFSLIHVLYIGACTTTKISFLCL